MTIRPRNFAPLLLALVCSYSCQGTDVGTLAVLPAAGPKDPIDSIALIEHRGRFYRVEDLTDPAFVAQSDDPFVKRFHSNEKVVQWAGSDVCSNRVPLLFGD